MSIKSDISKRIISWLLHKRLDKKDFTLITNNCWGAHIYQQLGRPYQTPFIGTFLAPDCYLNLIRDTEGYLSQPLAFIEHSRHSHINQYRASKKLNYPIALLGSDVEIQFLHYKNEAEALDKWCRRLSRVVGNNDSFFYKFCDRELATSEHIQLFELAPLKSKVCFTSKPFPLLQSTVWIPESEETQVVDGLMLSSISPKYFDAAGWVNGGNGKPGMLKLFLTV